MVAVVFSAARGQSLFRVAKEREKDIAVFVARERGKRFAGAVVVDAFGRRA